MSSFQLLVDSDALIGRFYAKDAHHQRSVKLFSALEHERVFYVVTSMVVDEVATVLSHRHGQDKAREFLHTITQTNLPVIHIDEALRALAIDLFKQQPQRGTSVTDCANVAVMRQFAIPQVFAFDQVYSRVFHLNNLAYLNEQQAA